MRLNIMVTTSYIEVATPDKFFRVEESQKVIDFNNTSDRKWLMNHQFWAMNNKRQVAIFPVKRGPHENTWQQETRGESN